MKYDKKRKITIWVTKCHIQRKIVEEVPQNMYRIPSAEENIIMEVPQKILIYTFSATLGHIGSSNIIFFKAPALECIFSYTLSNQIFSAALPL